MKKELLLALIILLLGSNVGLAQNLIRGKVIEDEKGLPLPGVQVIVKETTLGTITDIDGNYQIKVPADVKQLEFRYVGKKLKIVDINGRSIINVTMETQIELIEGVVITALGVPREKKSLGYATQGVKGEELMRGNDANAISSLSGKIAGLNITGQNFGGSKNILLRGASSFSQNNQPLFVIDGVPISNDNFNTVSTQNGSGGYDYGSMINDINSYDIESVEVLKGSAASALYGSRGQNGVIMITTKSGKKGGKTFSVEVNSGATFEQVSTLPLLQKRYGGGHGFNKVMVDGKEYLTVQYDVDESWGPKYDPNLNVVHWWNAADYETGVVKELQTAPWVTPKHDVDAFYNTGVAYQNAIGIVNSTETTSLRLGYTNASVTGVIPNSTQQKNNLNFSGTGLFFDKFIEVNTNVNYVHTHTNGRPEMGYGDNSTSQKFFQWGQRQLDFNRLKGYKNADGSMRAWNRISFSDPIAAYADNPYWTAYENFQDDDRSRIFGKTMITANFTDYLSATGAFYMDGFNFNQRERVSIGSQKQALFRMFNRQSVETNLTGKISFKKSIEDVSILAMVGGNIRNNSFTRFSANSNGGLTVHGIYSLNNSVNQASTDDYKERKRVNSWYGSASFGYKYFAYLDVTYRRDYDSSLPDDNNDYGYASIQASLILSELIKVDWIDNLKVRTNYGETGNGTNPYQVYNTWILGDPFNGFPQSYSSSILLNRDLKPELTSEVEVGMEGEFFDRRLGFDISFYDRNTKNQIVPIEISGSTGFLSRVINTGRIRNRGMELMFHGTPVKTQAFSWDLAFNFATFKNTVLDLPEDLPKIQIARAPFAGAFINSVKGASFQELYAYDYVYDGNGNRVIDANTGFYAQGPLKSMGSILPDYTMGVHNSFKYKNFDLGFLVDISKGGLYYSVTNLWGFYSGMLEETATSTVGENTIREDGLVLDGVIGDVQMDDDGNYTVTNTRPNNIPLTGQDFGANFYHANGTPSATSVFDASFFKLRELNLGYTIRKPLDMIQSVRISLFGRNLFVWGLGNKGIDPETLVGGSGNIQGLEGGVNPATRFFGLNLQVNF